MRVAARTKGQAVQAGDKDDGNAADETEKTGHDAGDKGTTHEGKKSKHNMSAVRKSVVTVSSATGTPLNTAVREMLGNKEDNRGRMLQDLIADLKLAGSSHQPAASTTTTKVVSGALLESIVMAQDVIAAQILDSSASVIIEGTHGKNCSRRKTDERRGLPSRSI